MAVLSGAALPFGLLTLALLWPALDAVGRLVRLRRFTGPRPVDGNPPASILAVVASRAEGATVLGIAGDLAREARSRTAATSLSPVIVLDGDDPATAAELAALDVEVLVKTPAGPDKGTALVFASARLAERIASASYVMVFDADTRLPEGWLASLRVPDGTEAFQLPGCPAGVPAPGAPRVEAFTLAVATRLEDLARDAAGLPVRLRGRAMGFTPAAWAAGPLAAHRTIAEDSEATLHLLQRGVRVRALSGPVAYDEPSQAGAAMSAPRARWLAGNLKLALVEAPALARLALARPLGAFVLFSDLFLRPRALVLTGLLAVGLGGIAAAAVRPELGVFVAPPAALAAGTLLAEAAYYRRGRSLIGRPPEVPDVTAADLAGALGVWLGAVGRAIVAPGRWHRARPVAR